MTVARLQGVVDGLADLTGGGLPGAESQSAVQVSLESIVHATDDIRDLSTGVESESLAERHDGDRQRMECREKRRTDG